MNMPTPFVHRLREMKIKQLQEAKDKVNTNNNPITNNQDSINGMQCSKNIIEEAIDELDV